MPNVRLYSPDPQIEGSLDIRFASNELVDALSIHTKNGMVTWGALLETLGLTLDSPVLLGNSTIYVQPGHTDMVLRLSTRKEF